LYLRVELLKILQRENKENAMAQLDGKYVWPSMAKYGQAWQSVAEGDYRDWPEPLSDNQ
jgi:hypothetical protein